MNASWYPLITFIAEKDRGILIKRYLMTTSALMGVTTEYKSASKAVEVGNVR